jgi:hypothetical protein
MYTLAMLVFMYRLCGAPAGEKSRTLSADDIDFAPLSRTTMNAARSFAGTRYLRCILKDQDHLYAARSRCLRDAY